MLEGRLWPGECQGQAGLRGSQEQVGLQHCWVGGQGLNQPLMGVRMVEKPWGDLGAQSPLSPQQLLVLTPESLETLGVRDGEIQIELLPLLLRGSCAGAAFLPSAPVAGLST